MLAEERRPTPATSRRAIMFASLAAPVLAASAALPAVAMARTGGPTVTWAAAEVLEAQCSALENDPPEALLDELEALEEATLQGVIRTRADCLAKLKAAAKSLERGGAVTGSDEAALADTIRWLEAN